MKTDHTIGEDRLKALRLMLKIHIPLVALDLGSKYHSKHEDEKWRKRNTIADEIKRCQAW